MRNLPIRRLALSSHFAFVMLTFCAGLATPPSALLPRRLKVTSQSRIARRLKHTAPVLGRRGRALPASNTVIAGDGIRPTVVTQNR